ncbi:hypothetical protein CVB86_25230, partial [Salmonella enterica subsp. enterica serovar Kentucky]
LLGFRQPQSEEDRLDFLGTGFPEIPQPSRMTRWLRIGDRRGDLEHRAAGGEIELNPASEGIAPEVVIEWAGKRNGGENLARADGRC